MAVGTGWLALPQRARRFQKTRRREPTPLSATHHHGHRLTSTKRDRYSTISVAACDALGAGRRVAVKSFDIGGGAGGAGGGGCGSDDSAAAGAGTVTARGAARRRHMAAREAVVLKHLNACG